MQPGMHHATFRVTYKARSKRPRVELGVGSLPVHGIWDAGGVDPLAWCLGLSPGAGCDLSLQGVT